MVPPLSCIFARCTLFARWKAVLLGLSLAATSAQADLKQAAAYSAKTGERALIVWSNGRIVEERYSNGGRTDKSENLYSITKTLAALSILTAVGRGSIKLDEPVSQTLTEWRGDPLKKKITVRQLLSQTSGLDPGYEALYNTSLKNKDTAVLKLGTKFPPGEVFAYGPSHYEALATFIARKTGRLPSTWAEDVFLSPADIHPARWRTDRMGNPYFSAGLFTTARELLKAAQITRRQGWIWFFPIIPSKVMQEASTGSSANPMYGYGFWLNKNAGKPSAAERDVEEAISARLGRTEWASSCLSKNAPSDLIAFVGSSGQRVYISPSRKLIIVRLGKGSGFRDPDFLRAYFR